MLILILGLVLQSDADIARLIDRLGADFLDERTEARRELEKIGAKAEGPLLRALGSPDHRVRRAALDLLALSKPAAARPKAAELFAADDDASVQAAAFRLLQALGAEEDLILALAHPSPEFRRGAVESLRTLQSPRAVKPLADLYDREAIPAVKEAAFGVLLAMGGAAEAFLLKGLAVPDVKDRRRILEALRGIDSDPVLVGVGRHLLVEGDPGVLDLVGEILSKAGERAAPYWVQGLGGAKEQARILSAKGLAAIKHRSGAAKAGALVLTETVDAAREAMADYLAAIGGPEAEAAFLKGLKTGSPAVKALSIRKLGELKLAAPLSEVAQSFRSEKDASLRRACFDFLAALGKAAELDLIRALEDEDRSYRIDAAKALGEAGSEAAIPKLLEALEDLEPGMRAAAEGALARLGSKALEAAREAVGRGRLKARALESLEGLVTRERVEAELDRLITDSGGTGFFAGQFQALAALGRETAGPVLLRIATDPRTALRGSAKREHIPDYDSLVRSLAIMALGELGVAGSKEPLQRIVQETEAAGGEHHDEALLALHRLGEPGPLEEHLRKLETKAEEALQREEFDEEGAAALFSQGRLLNRAGRRAEAAKAYRRLVEAAAKSAEEARVRLELPAALYNLACLASLGGEKAKAVDLLAQAVKAGYRDRAWIELDKDLDPLRGEEGYRALLADESLLPRAPAPR